MHNAFRVIAICCFLVPLSVAAQDRAITSKIVLPSPSLIHCHSVACSQLWNRDSGNGADYPAKVLTDFVNGEVVGLTAVYDKSVSTEEIQSGIDALYGKWRVGLPSDKHWLWRIESEQLEILLVDRDGGTKSVTYVKIGTTVPSLHIEPITTPSRAGDLASSFEQAVALAEAQPQDGATRTYNAVDLMPQYQQKYNPVFQACLKSTEQPETSPFSFVAAIGPDGRVLRLYADHETNMFACVRPMLEKDEFPHPPFAPYYMHVSMQFSK